MNFFQAKAYLRYLRKAKGADGIHSPFVFDLYMNALKSDKFYVFFEEGHRLRKELRSNNEVLNVTDYGSRAPEGNSLSYKRKVSEIAKNSLLPEPWAERLFRVTDFVGANQVLEIGTSLGLTTRYLAEAVPENGMVISLEGCPETANQARKLNSNLQVRIIEGKASQTINEALKILEVPDLVFVDANHRKKPTLDFYNIIKGSSSENTVIIFDDIHWSKEMEEAWNLICSDEEVTLSIDAFRTGFVFFRKKQPKQHFILRV